MAGEMTVRNATQGAILMKIDKKSLLLYYGYFFSGYHFIYFMYYVFANYISVYLKEPFALCDSTI